MDQEAIIAQFEALGAVLRGHFVLNSGRHADTFVSKDMVSSSPTLLRALVEEITTTHPEWYEEMEVVAAPAVGAVPFGTLVARGFAARFAYAEPASETEMEFRRGFAKLITPGTGVLIVEDIITTGKTVRQMIAAVEKLGGKVVGVLLLWLRGENDLGNYPLVALVDKKLPTWVPSECPLCRNSVPITVEYNKHGQEFLNQYGADPDRWPANKK